MTVTVLLFGRLTDITGSRSVTLEDVADTDQATRELHRLYPALAGTPYILAVNEQVINGNTTLIDNNTMALLPPYSGG